MTAGAAPSRPPKPEMPPFAGLPDLPALRELQSRPKWVAWDYRWKAETRAEVSPKASTSERASASARERGPREGADFWRTVNDRALSNLGSWVTSIFPGARYQSGTCAYRVDQRDLGEGYEEDLSLHPDGIRDFGSGDMGDSRDGARTPIDVVRDYLPATDPTAAAMWLCERLGVRPEDIGWKGGKRDECEAPRDNAQAEPPPERKRIAIEAGGIIGLHSSRVDRETAGADVADRHLTAEALRRFARALWSVEATKGDAARVLDLAHGTEAADAMGSGFGEQRPGLHRRDGRGRSI